MKKRFHTRQTTFRQLEIFLAVAEHGSVTEAAHQLHLAQPTVSTQLGRLGEALGAPLFEQIGKRLFLTAVGEDVASACRELFGVMDRLEMTLARRAGLSLGSLRLGVVTTAKYIVPGLLGPFCKRYPDVEVQFQVGNRAEIIQRLEQNRDDLYVFSHPPQHLDIELRPLVENPLVAIAPLDHPLAAARNIPLARLAEEGLLLREAGSGTRHAIEQYFGSQGLRLRPRMTIASNEAIKESVAAGLGMAILSRHALTHMAPGNLVELDVQGLPIPNRWYLVHWRSKVLSPIAEAFMREVEAQSGKETRSPAPTERPDDSLLAD